MEQLLVRFLPSTPRYPIWARYVLTIALVALTFGVRLLLEPQLSGTALVLFIPAIFLASVAFDRGSGFLATLASAALAATDMPPLSSATIIPLAIFVLTGLTIATVTEVLRQTVGKLSDAKTHADVLLQELAHRTRNDLATIVSILRLQARTSAEPAAQAALASAISRVEVLVKVHDRLQDSTSDQKVQLAPYVDGLCQTLAELHRGVRPIAIQLRCDDISLKNSQAALVGLIVNELVTNAFKYAFPAERPAGTIEVNVQQTDQQMTITVTDDGVGCPNDAKSGLGTRLINLLTAQMKGTMTRSALPQGCQVQVTVALET
jgi:two-component sensor histidine kinase